MCFVNYLYNIFEYIIINIYILENLMTKFSNKSWLFLFGFCAVIFCTPNTHRKRMSAVHEKWPSSYFRHRESCCYCCCCCRCCRVTCPLFFILASFFQFILALFRFILYFLFIAVLIYPTRILSHLSPFSL